MVRGAALSYLCFVNQLGDAERSVLHLARRSLAYKAAKLGHLGLISLDRLGGVRLAVEQLEQATIAIAGDLHGHDAAPPPLILCAADAHLGRPSLEQLLGSAGLLPPIGGAVRAAEELLDQVEVVGFYFAASWCAACDICHDAHAMHMPCTCRAHAMHMPCTCHAHAMHVPCTRYRYMTQYSAWPSPPHASMHHPPYLKVRGVRPDHSVDRPSILGAAYTRQAARADPRAAGLPILTMAVLTLALLTMAILTMALLTMAIL